MSTRSSTLTRSKSTIDDSQSVPADSTAHPRLMQLMKSLYQEDQQAKFLHLQAEVESLLQQVQTLKQQRLANHDSADNNS